MGKKKVAFIELTVFAGVYPLASGYMKAVALQDPQVREHYSFELHSICINNSTFESKIDSIDADVYAISCYVWNMGFVKRWLPTLFARKPDAHVILGGPQVMNHASQYLVSSNERVVICNGEGEYTFASYLAALCSETPDLSSVKGLSYYRGGNLCTTEAQPRVQDLNAIPSPYLENFFDPRRYTWATIETNRGCPFKCTYCFWGAATNAKVYKTDLDRVKQEITWLAKNRAMYIFITDANFGMLPRDVEIAEHLAHCRATYGYPITVWLSPAKNSVERVTEITRILSREGMISTQPVSLQTMDTVTLRSVKRSNIKESSYLALQAELRQSKLSSFIEMIWPLPGETLESFKTGLGKLCSYDADALVIHHLLLINNVEMNQQREEYQMQLADDADPNSEAKVVIATRDVSPEEYVEGVRFGYHLTSLFSLRGLRFVSRHLDANGLMSFKDIFSAFGAWCEKQPEHPYVRYIHGVIGARGQTKFSANGGIFHTSLHAYRDEFDQLLLSFMQSTGLLNDEFTAFLFDMDLLNRPHVYCNTPVGCAPGLLQQATIVDKGDGWLAVRLPRGRAQTAAELLRVEQLSDLVKIRYRSTQMPFMENKPYEDNLSYCEGKLHKMGSILPKWEVLEQTRMVGLTA